MARSPESKHEAPNAGRFAVSLAVLVAALSNVAPAPLVLAWSVATRLVQAGCEFTLLVSDGTRLTRPLKLLGQMLRHPWRLAKSLWPVHWGRRTLILLVMQSFLGMVRDISFALSRWYFSFKYFQSSIQLPKLFSRQ